MQDREVYKISLIAFTSTPGAAAYAQPLNWVSQFTPIDTKSVPLSLMIRQQQKAHLIKHGEIQHKT